MALCAFSLQICEYESVANLKIRMSEALPWSSRDCVHSLSSPHLTVLSLGNLRIKHPFSLFCVVLPYWEAPASSQKDSLSAEMTTLNIF